MNLANTLTHPVKVLIMFLTGQVDATKGLS